METERGNKMNDFSKGSVSGHILKLALPMILAQLINILYNMVDRIYIGRLGQDAACAMSALGICLPAITIIIAFANLVGMGGSPLVSIARGKKDIGRAQNILNHAFLYLCFLSVVLFLIGFIFARPILFAFGASQSTISYALIYLRIYLCGTLFTMISLGMNSFINAQGFAKTGMMTVLIGAILNIVLDPVFIFLLHMGVAGAALATILSQFVSMLWTIRFLRSDKTIIRLDLKSFRFDFSLIQQITQLGMAGFMMAVTNSIVSAVCNNVLQIWGGDLYIAVMTVINSLRELASLPGQGFANAGQPVLGFNYGARQFGRVQSGIKAITLFTVLSMTVFWIFILCTTSFLFRIFTNDAAVVAAGIHSAHLYFFGFFMMAFQMSGQSTAMGLGRAKQAIFFSIFRKVIVVVPLTLLLPYWLGVDGVFIAEAVSNFIGGGACYITMLLTIWKSLKTKKS